VQRVAAFLDQRADGRALGIARIILGLAAILKGIATATIVHSYQSGNYLSIPYAISWLATPSGMFATGLSLLWIIFAFFFMIGFGARLSGALLAVVIFMIIAIDQQFYSNHLYLLGTAVVLLTLAGPGSRFSIDARRSRVEPTVPRWALLLIMLQLTTVYFFAAVTKLNEGFLSGAVMRRAFEPSMRERVEQVIAPDVLAPLTIGTELFLAFAFWSARLRLVALPVALGFHLLNVVIMGRSGTINLSIFALIMFSMMIVFFTTQNRGQEDQV
jgi:hypothetical protein